MVTNVAIDYGAGISDAWSSIAKFVPKLAAFLVILVIGWIIAKILAKIVTTILRKVGFDRLAERSGLAAALAKSNYDASSLLAKIVYYAILLITLQLAIGAFGPNPISDLLTRFVAWLPKLFIAIIIIVITAAIAQAVREIIQNALSGASYGKMVGTVAFVFILGAGIVAALNQIGVATAVTTPVLIAVLATVGGVIVVGVGGGLIKPMQSRWETALTRVADEIPARRAASDAPAPGTSAAAARGQHASSYGSYAPPAQPYEAPQTQAYQQEAPPAPPTQGYPQQGYQQDPGQTQGFQQPDQGYYTDPGQDYRGYPPQQGQPPTQ